MNSNQIIHPTMEFVPKHNYDDMIIKYNELKKENDELKKALLIERDRYSEIKKEVINLEEIVIKLQKENEELRKEIKKRDDEIIKRDKRIDNLEKQMNILMDERDKKKNMMITSEMIILYDKLVTDEIMGTNDHKYKLCDLVFSRVELNAKQQERYNEFNKSANNNANKLVNMLSLMKKERNYESHEKYQDPDINTTELEHIMKKYVLQSKEIKNKNPFNKLVDNVIKRIKKECGECPFNKEENYDEVF